MKIGIMGAGGIGGYLGARLAQAGHDVRIVARGAHLAAIQCNGLRLESPHGDFHARDVQATDNPGDIGPVDIVIFAVKLKDTEQAAKDVAPMIGPDTRVVTLQNGIDSKRLIARFVPEGQIAAGIIYLAAHIGAPGVIVNPGGIHKSVIDAMESDPVMAEFLEAAATLVGADVTGTNDIGHVIWEKFVALSAFSAVCCIARQPVGVIYASPPLLDLFRDTLAENVAVARAMGQRFDDAHVERVVEMLSHQPHGQKASMLIDLEAGKPLELPWLAGRVSELGKEQGVPTPINTTIFAALSPYIDGPPKSGG
ncbi:ketopantoate reductase family protein [Oceanibium sediminis]|uniref:ketopantoate reductase family protein n=1 Tax=Oceanibium sediminis TaxID=2026339 RepID=UPI0013009619|nr:2-dehydropantoate 2-reductase [Oceanibium sediminis]